MSNHVSFPAAHLSAYDIGKRIQVITVDGAKVADTLIGIGITLRDDKARILLTFKSVNYADSYGAGAFEVAADQYVRRIAD